MQLFRSRVIRAVAAVVFVGLIGLTTYFMIGRTRSVETDSPEAIARAESTAVRPQPDSVLSEAPASSESTSDETDFPNALATAESVAVRSQADSTLEEGALASDDSTSIEPDATEATAAAESVEQGTRADSLLREPSTVSGESTQRGNVPPRVNATLLILMLVFSFVALIVSIWVNVFLLKWRRAVTASDVSIVPSELLDVVDAQTNAFHGLAKQQSRASEALVRRIQEESTETRTSFAELLRAFTALQKALSEKDAEIQRLRGGYDAEIYRRFLARFIRLEKVIAEDLAAMVDADGDARQALEDVKHLLEDALAECGLETFSPEVGESVREAFGVDEHYQHRPTRDAEKVLTIASVVEPGWRIRTPVGFDCVTKARVAVFVGAAEQEGES